MDQLAEYVNAKCYNQSKCSLISNMTEAEAKEHLSNLSNRILFFKDSPPRSDKYSNEEKIKIINELIRLNELKLSIMNL